MPRAAFSFNGQTAIVTGGTRGIGAAISSAFVRAGGSVVAVYAGDDVAAAAFKASLGDDGSRVALEKVDVSDDAQVTALFDRLRARGQDIHVLVNSAGIRKDAVLAMMGVDSWRQVLDVNLTGTFLMCKHAVREMMSRRWGRIVNISSPSGELGFAGQANYAASKAGQVALARSLSKEVASRGITVNCVSPGFIDTALIADLSPEQVAQYKAMVPMKRFGTPADVAEVVLFLASDSAAYVTGAVYDVTGGL